MEDEYLDDASIKKRWKEHLEH